MEDNGTEDIPGHAPVGDWWYMDYLENIFEGLFKEKVTATKKCFTLYKDAFLQEISANTATPVTSPYYRSNTTVPSTPVPSTPVPAIPVPATVKGVGIAWQPAYAADPSDNVSRAPLDFFS